MNTVAFNRCLSYRGGIQTGISGNSIVGIYDFASGSGISGLNLIYNLLYNTGYNFSGNQIYGPALPVINVGSGNISGYNFNGRHISTLGYSISGDFSVILDIDYDGCVRNTTGISSVLISTATTATGLSGLFYVGINDVNRLFFETSGYSKTITHELHKNNLVYLGLGNQNEVELGIFDIANQELLSEQFVLPNNQKSINTVYLGGLLNNNNPSYTGFSGKIVNVVLANRALEIEDVTNCSNCLFATGFTSGSGTVTNLVIPTITGYLFSGVQEFVITGYTPYTGVLTKNDGTTVNVVFPSGQTGLKQTFEIATVLTGVSSIQITGSPTLTFANDTRLSNYLTYDIVFDNSLISGDTIEIYTYPEHNPSIGIPIDYKNYPSTNQFVQLIGNGLVETLNVDYEVIKNQIEGFNGEDVLIADFLTGESLVTAFSGWWNRSKTLMSGGTYYPPTGQFNETIDTGRILITGITGKGFTRNYDLYLNGQKLISGYNYYFIDAGNSGIFGNQTGLTVAVLVPTTLPDAVVEFSYSVTGGLPTGVLSVEDSELSFLPNFINFNKYYQDVTGTFSLTGVTTGFNFSEQIWINGLRLTENIDYSKIYRCTTYSGEVSESNLPFMVYDNYTGYFNLI